MNTEDIPQFDAHEPDAEAQRDIGAELRAGARVRAEEHERVVEGAAAQLAAEDSSEVERSLYRLAAHDTAMLRELGRAELAIVKQIAFLSESAKPKSISALTKVLLDIQKARTDMTRRAGEVLKTSESIAAQRRLAATHQQTTKPSHLRRVV